VQTAAGRDDGAFLSSEDAVGTELQGLARPATAQRIERQAELAGRRKSRWILRYRRVFTSSPRPLRLAGRNQPRVIARHSRRRGAGQQVDALGNDLDQT
jgi:hypothetical protein